jgi:hypothetical protein
LGSSTPQPTVSSSTARIEKVRGQEPPLDVGVVGDAGRRAEHFLVDSEVIAGSSCAVGTRIVLCGAMRTPSTVGAYR